MMSDLRVIILAAQRQGGTDPLAQRFGVSHKCLIPLQGRAMIAHVLETVVRHPSVASVTIAVEPQAFEAIEREIPQALRSCGTIRFVPAADNLADSVRAAAEGCTGALIITTADNALLAPASIDAMATMLKRREAAIAMAPRSAVLAAHPDGQRRFYRFRCGEYSNCNLYGLGSTRALQAAEVFRGGGQFARRAGRIVQAFGIINLILLRLRAVSLEGALRRISRRLRVDIAAVVLPDGSQAIDVDNERTYGVVSALLEQRAEPEPAWPAALRTSR